MTSLYKFTTISFLFIVLSHSGLSAEYDKHGLLRLVNRVIYKENGVYKGSIPKMQSASKSGFKIAGACKIASTTLKTFYKRDLNEIAEYYSDLFGDVYVQALDTDQDIAEGAASIYRAGHSAQTSKWAGQRMSIIRSTLALLHGDLGLEGPQGMPHFPANLKNSSLTPDEFTKFMVSVKKKAETSKTLTTNMAAALASSPSQLNGLVEKSSFVVKDKISGLLADPAGGDSEVPVEMQTSPDVFNPQNVGDLFLALGIVSLHIQNPEALASAGIKPPTNVQKSLDLAKAKFITDDKATGVTISKSKQGKAKWDSAPLGPARI